MVTPDEQTPHAAASENQRPDVRPIVVTVATYRRPRLLAELLRSLESMSSKRTFRVVVVDNDADASAREVALSSALEVTYVVESAPGIAEARNRGLDEVTSADSAVVFVDDDERVAVDWLDKLVAGWRLDPWCPSSPRIALDGSSTVDSFSGPDTGRARESRLPPRTTRSCRWQLGNRRADRDSILHSPRQGVATRPSSRCWSAGGHASPGSTRLS
jgi:glycosyltransferase involved in cell wall biosynthesis